MGKEQAINSSVQKSSSMGDSGSREVDEPAIFPPSENEMYINEICYPRIEADKLEKKREHIAKGSTANIYKAEWLGFICAVKVFTKAEEVPLKKVPLKEVKILAKLHHPHVVQLLGISIDSQGTFLMVMEFKSKNLRELIESQMQNLNERVDIRPFCLSEAMDIMIKIALAVAYMHSRGIVHRDLKPHNVMAEEHGNSIGVKIVDFGSSKIYLATSSCDIIPVGTAYWRAPEILQLATTYKSSTTKQKEDYITKLDLKAADVYSFAIICNEVLTDRALFPDLRLTKYDKVILEKLRPSLPSDLHPGLKDLIKKYWDDNPGERPNFTKICEELQSIQRDLPPHREGLRKKAKKWLYGKSTASQKDVSMSLSFEQISQVRGVIIGLLAVVIQGYGQSVNSPAYKSRSRGVHELEVCGIQRRYGDFAELPWYARAESNNLKGVQRLGKNPHVGIHAEVCKAARSDRTFTVKMATEITHPNAAARSRFSHPSSLSLHIAPICGFVFC